MRVYISGKMTGCPDLNRQAFDAAEKRLTAGGNFVINPHRIGALFGTADELADAFSAVYRVNDYMPECRLARSVIDADLSEVRSCDVIYLLKGWKTSRGARRELAEALKYGLEIFEEGDEK